MVGKAAIEHNPRWPVVSLAEIATKIGSGATPKGGGDTYLPHRARFALVRSQNVFDRRFDHDGLAFITDEQADGLRGVVLQPDDVLLNITGDGITFGRACMVPKDVLPACVNQHVSIIRVDPKRADAGYVLAFLTHPDVKSYIESFNAGGSRRAITKGHIESFRLPLPPLSEQRAIAHILGTLDDKIELNRRTNDTTEAMARALFKSWLVDFEPVRAKAEGRDPGLPKPLADLFPDSFEDSELGELPKGWEVRGLDEIGRFLNGLALQKYPPSDGKWLPVIKIAQLRAGGTNGADRASADLPPDYVVDDGDVLFSWSGSLECVIWAGGKGALNQHLFKVTSKEFPKWFFYLWIVEHLSDFRHIAAAKATTMGHIQRHHLSEAKVVIPPRDFLAAADQHFRPLIDAIPQRLVQSRNLGVVRDELLPKLIAGEVQNRERGEVRGEQRMSTLTPWALGPFEIILHAEMHYRDGDDLDRRIAIVSFDNAIELAIHTYLSLHPIQRQNRIYPKTDVEKWLDNYHTKVEFFINEVTTRGLPIVCDRAKFIWYHEVRNGQYHVGGATIPQARELEGIREAAIWVFSVLFEMDDVIPQIEQHLTARSGDDLPKRNDDDDRLIDSEYGTVNLAGKPYYVSEVVHRFDPVWYSELAGEIKARDASNKAMNEEPQE